MADYLENAVDAAEGASVYVDLDPEYVRPMIEAAEPFIRQDERKKLREQTGRLCVEVEETVQEIDGADEDGLDLTRLADRLTVVALRLDLHRSFFEEAQTNAG